MRYELTDHEWAATKRMLPNKPRGVPRLNERRVLSGIFWVLRSGAPPARIGMAPDALIRRLLADLLNQSPVPIKTLDSRFFDDRAKTV